MKSMLTLDSILPEVTRRPKRRRRALDAMADEQLAPAQPSEPVKEEAPAPKAVAAKPEAAEDIISLVVDLFADEESVLADVRRLDVSTGDRKAELVRFRLDGAQSFALPLGPSLDAGERRVVEAMSDSDAAKLMLVSGNAISLKNGYKKLAEAITALSPARGTMFAASDTLAAIYAPGNPAIHVLRVKSSGSVRTLTLEDLKLGGWRSISCIQVVESMLYVAVTDPVGGFDLFVCDLKKKTLKFEPVIVRGGHRFASNAMITTMVPTETGLILGTAALASPAERVGNWGPEVISLDHEGNWDLSFGVARFTPNGYKAPLSGETAGVGELENAAVQAIAHDGTNTIVAIQSFIGLPEEDRRDVVSDLLDYGGAVRLYVTKDMKSWRQISVTLPDDFGPITSLCMTKEGAFLGYESIVADKVPLHFVPIA
ncbi:hypothetical protein [Celeribacter litoreus]|uniref:hypothetical protein n=1 Tax=Celeribacter litoreus TaxID=2876714 RepID=UPI001CC9B9A7|nr:hypothetical protein [Celeribacter litoreus]MCA0045083.1 hypothetical protein [Celeribacter litoreus]